MRQAGAATPLRRHQGRSAYLREGLAPVLDSGCWVRLGATMEATGRRRLGETRQVMVKSVQRPLDGDAA